LQYFGSRQLDFIYIKATEGATHKDTLAAKHYSEAKKRDLTVGFYHFFSVQSSAKAQFQNYVSAAQAADLPPVIDFEHIAEKVKSEKQKKDVYAKLCALDSLMMQEYGKEPIIYTNPKDYLMFFKGNAKYAHRLWMPHGRNTLISQWGIGFDKYWIDFNVKKS